MFKIVPSILMIIVLGSVCYGSVVINEIMYNPNGDEYDFEYIELYGEGENISNWYFEGIDFSFPKDTYINGYLTIANTLNESGENNDFIDRYPYANCSFEYVGSLLNTGETIILRDNEGKIKDIITYYDSARENCSLERIDKEGHSNDPDNWAESVIGGSPGKENSRVSDESCDWTISVILNDTVFEKLEFQIKTEKTKGKEKTNLTIIKWIEDSKGNTVEKYSPWNIKESLNSASSGKYSPTLKKGEAYFIKANITEMSCQDADLSNNLASKMVYVISDEEDKTPNSTITIIDPPSSVKFGDIINLEMSLYKGNTSKYAVYAYIEDNEGKKVSEKSTIHMAKKFTGYTMTIPLQVKPNCDDGYIEGAYKIIVEGLDTRDEKEIRIEGKTGNLCKTIEIEIEEQSEKKSKFSYEIMEMPSTVYLNNSFDIFLRIENNGDEEIRLDIWSYVYRGNKKYSAEKENLKQIRIDEEDNREVRLTNKVIEGKEGSYKLKVKILKRGRKTTYDKTEDIYLKVLDEENDKTVKEEKTEKKEEQNDDKGTTINIIRSSTVYESESIAVKKLIPLFLVILFLLSLIFSLIRANN